MALDIHSAVIMGTVLAGIAAVFSLLAGIRSISKARNLRFFRMRRNRMIHGWRLMFATFAWGLLALLLYMFAEPVAYNFFPPSTTPTLSPTITLTPSVTPTPSITLTPTITETPSETDTPTITSTPHIPLAVEAQFEGELTPPADAVFSQLNFTNLGVDALYRPLEATDVFTNPVGEMYAVFTYDSMVDGVQWTALWFRNGELVNFETKPWDGGTGGSGYTDWKPKAEEWLPGNYEVQIFIGLDWQRQGYFTIIGDPPTPTTSPTPTLTSTPTPSNTPTQTTVPTSTRTPSKTPWPTLTRTPTPPPSATMLPTLTPTKVPRVTPPTRTPTMTRWPVATPITPTPTITRWPLATPITPSPTITRWPTPTK